MQNLVGQLVRDGRGALAAGQAASQSDDPFKDHITGWLAAWVLRQGEGVEVVAPVES